ncbi:hypothetical protein CBR_g21143 [Chara braunii]|uniref:Uncharacterized protein n=1 Tax=Chara braunii TaxID=69332 RepID=A0A388L0U3_CHABU|nr:hypothetical protein CBR_g21143 [Chara braunii]|eukprot:GBG75901.1 hypothetical protein CBR_g21143 [Chara braunii]
MEALTDNEKCCVLKKVLACEVVWVQAGSPSLAKLGKLSMQEMVQLVKCHRVLVGLWNYYQSKHEKRSDADSIQKYPFLKSRSSVFKKFKNRGLDSDFWDGSRKYVSDATLFKNCPPYMGCDEDHSIRATEKLVGHRKLTIDLRNKVLFVLTGSRLKNREIALAEGIVHIKWKGTGDMTSIAPFDNDPLEADIRSAELKEAGSVYGDMECNPTQFVGLLDFVSQKGEGVVFLGKPHARSVWKLLKAATGVEFNINAKEEESDTESLDLQYDPPPAEHAQGSLSADVSTSPAPLVSPMAKLAPGTTPMKLLERLRDLAVPPRALRPGSDVPPDHPSWKDDNIQFLLEPQSHLPEVDWGHDMIWHPGVIQPAIQKGEWVMAVAVPGAGWVSIPRESKFNFLHLARISVLQKVRAENDTFAPDDLSIVSTVGRLFDKLQDKCWLELTKDYYELNTSLSKGMVDWKVPPPSGAHGSSGGGAPGGGGDGDGSAGGGKGVPRSEEGRSHSGTTTPGGSGGVAGFAVDRHPSTDPGPKPTTQSANQPSSSVSSAREILAALVTLGNRSGGTLKSAGSELRQLRCCKSGPPCRVARGCGSRTRIPQLAAVREGAKGDVGIGDDEGEDSEDDAGSGNSSDEFEQLYGEHHKDDVDDDATAIEMETQVVTSLSAEPEDYEVQPLTSVVDLQHRFDEASVTMSTSKASRRISIKEVVDGILGDQHVSAHPSRTLDVDDAQNVKSSVAPALAFSPPNSPVLSATLAGRGEGEVRGRQHVTSPKKSRVDTQALDVLAFPAPTSPTKERRDKPTGVGSSRTRRSSKYPEHILQKIPGLTTEHKDMLKASGVDVEIGKKEHVIAIEECLSLLAPEKGTYPRSVTRGQAMYEKYLTTRATGDNAWNSVSQYPMCPLLDVVQCGPQHVEQEGKDPL